MVVARGFYKSSYLHCLIRVLVQLHDVYKGTHGPGHTLLRTQSRIRVNSKAWMTGACRSISTDQEACCSSALATRNLGGLDYTTLLSCRLFASLFKFMHAAASYGHTLPKRPGPRILHYFWRRTPPGSSYSGTSQVSRPYFHVPRSCKYPEANKARDISPDETIFTIRIVVPWCSHLPRYKPLAFGLA